LRKTYEKLIGSVILRTKNGKIANVVTDRKAGVTISSVMNSAHELALPTSCAIALYLAAFSGSRNWYGRSRSLKVECPDTWPGNWEYRLMF
jgi:hypothetical protein